MQFGWPLGMPVVPASGRSVEVRSNLDDRIARVMFVAADGLMVLLHAFIEGPENAA